MLRRAVCAEIVARGLPRVFANRINATFLYRVYFVDDLAVRGRLAKLIAEGKLEGDAASDAIAEETVKVSHGGRPPRAAAVRVLRRIARILQIAKEKHELDARALRGLKGAEIGDARMAIAELRGILDEAEAELD
jgi:hypothetical protein